MYMDIVPAGGYDRGECVDAVEAFNIHTNSWKTLPKLLTARGRLDATQLDGRLYACGGSDGSKELQSAECFDPEVNKWLALPDMSVGRTSAGG